MERLRKAQRENQKEINALVNSLAKMAGTPGEQSILDGINQRSEKDRSIRENIQELEQTLRQQNLQARSFEALRGVLRSFSATVDDMTVEQKRLALGLYMMTCRRTGGSIVTALLYVHSFRSLLAHTFWETGRIAGTDPETLVTTADKLRYCRHVRGLEQLFSPLLIIFQPSAFNNPVQRTVFG